MRGKCQIADDILVVGEGGSMEEAIRDHNDNLTALLERCRTRGVKINKEKFSLKLDLQYANA